MGILDLIAANNTDASETLSPPSVGGNITDRKLVKEVLGGKCALIGGMDQHNILSCSNPQTINKEVKELFGTYGDGGGYIMSASDHFFNVPLENLQAYSDAAKECTY